VPLLCYEFGEFELDCARFELRRNSRVLKLERIPLELLILLAEKDGSVVTRQEISERLWGRDVFVDTEHGINTAVRKIRAALQEDADRPRYVQTVPGKGYRFVAELKRDNGGAGTAPQPAAASSPVISATASVPEAPAKTYLRWRAVATAAGALCLLAAALFGFNAGGLRDMLFARGRVAPIHSIAVLPLANLSGDPSQEYFADGMTDELITEIAKFTRLRVISHSSVQRYKGTQKPLAQIARELGVDAVVEGSVTRSGNRVRIATRLIDARSERNLWAEIYEHDIQDVLAVQQEVATQVTSQLGTSLASSAHPTLQNPPVVDPEAHEAYLRGLFYWNQFSCDAFKRSLGYFQQSQAKDPTFAPVYIGLAQSYGALYNFDCLSGDETLLPAARAAALKALALDPTSGAAHTILGRYALNNEVNRPKAEAEFRRAIELDPNDALARSGHARVLLAMGQREQAFAETTKALELDPTSLATNVSAAFFYYLAHEFDLAIQQGKKTVELYPNSPASYLWLAAAYEKKGLERDSIAAHLKSEAIWGASHKDLAGFEQAYQKEGMRGYWLYELSFATTRGWDKAPLKLCWMAAIHAQLGDNKLALDYLRRGVQHPCNEMSLLTVHPFYDPLRNDEGFKQLLAQLHF